ncbi:MAG: universal stress protein [Gemmatimonadetes bacterium]|nr:universal stress protein [Gemmatimonadota bacterium]
MSLTTTAPFAGTDTADDVRGIAPRADGPIVVASDGTTSADAAVRLGAQLVARGRGAMHVVTVLPPAPLVAADYGVLLPPIETEQQRRDALVSRVRAQLRELLGSEADVVVEVRSGDPASRVAAYAREIGARTIVVGLGHHDLLDRLFGGETALHILRQASVPVLAVPAQAQVLPSRVIVAMDFSPTSVQAAKAALAVFPGVSILYLAHVAPRLELQPEAYAAWMTEYQGGVEPAFQKVRAELHVPPQVTIETITLTGKPSRALLDFARSAHVDAIVTGSRGAGFVDRMLVGSTATGLVRGAHVMVFGVPSGSAPVEVSGSHEEWATRLTDFTRRNAGRDATLEVDDPDLGAQTIHRGYPFLGAAWDHNDQRVELMLGEQDTTRHFTRGVTGVTAVDVLTDGHGRDAVLRIAHGSGQTILTLVR